MSEIEWWGAGRYSDDELTTLDFKYDSINILSH